ncbi:Ff.00g077580.m01.CDS01 [Fusarium sp. VM40]|nr:Ff.00g077580.m01.CDS01 [Fusarium sp. VM40]
MGTAVNPQTWIEIGDLISKALDAREKYRKGPQNQRTMATTWKPIERLLHKFPEGTFTTYDYDTVSNIDPYCEEVLATFTEIIWAFSSGPVLDGLDCPQAATDYYSYFGQDLYQIWYRSSDNSTWSTLFSRVTNDIANYSLITTDTTSRSGLVNSPRAAMAAHAWVITNSMCGSGPASHAIATKARQLWEDRCGHFVETEN